MQQYLQEVSQDHYPAWARDRARMALAITEQYQGGGLDLSEYQELMRDLVRMDRLDAEADSIEIKTMLISAVYALAKISG